VSHVEIITTSCQRAQDLESGTKQIGEKKAIFDSAKEQGQRIEFEVKIKRR
jgi:hypothetical protein